MTKYLLCLNHSKTEFLIIGFREKLSKLTHSSDPISNSIPKLQSNCYPPFSPLISERCSRCSRRARSARRALSMAIALALFWSWLRSF